jgi:methionine-rich copper-binding protein CopC
MRLPLRLLTCLAVLTTWLAGAAHAHALLLSFKIDGQDVVMQYNGRVDVARSRLTLLDQDGANPRKLETLPGGDAASLKAHLGELPAGSYILRWEVLSVDGHISRGDQPVTLPAR